MKYDVSLTSSGLHVKIGDRKASLEFTAIVDFAVLVIGNKNIEIKLIMNTINKETAEKILEYANEFYDEINEIMEKAGLTTVTVKLHYTEIVDKNKFLDAIKRAVNRTATNLKMESRCNRILEMIEKSMVGYSPQYSYIEYDGKKILIELWEGMQTLAYVFIIDRKKILRYFRIAKYLSGYGVLMYVAEIVLKKYYKTDHLKTYLEPDLIEKIRKTINNAPIEENIRNEFLEALNRRLEIEVANKI